MREQLAMARSSGSAGKRRGQSSMAKQRSPVAAEENIQIFGIHAVGAALRNSRRPVSKLYLTQNAERRLGSELAERGLSPERVLPKALDRMLGADTVHQGALAECDPLPEPSLVDLIEAALSQERPLVVLDQVTDPHNVGAVLRSASVFGAVGLIMTRRHSPRLGGALAKAASGALETVPVALVQNLARALLTLAESGFQVLGLDGEATDLIEDMDLRRPTAVVLGAEGKGLRQGTQAVCTAMGRIEADGDIASLNVSNACAIALHVLAMARRNRL